MEAATQTKWQHFAEETSMHGVNRLSDRQIGIVRRLIWAVIMLGSLAILCFGAYNLLDKFRKKSTTTKLSVMSTDVMKFPAITVCNRNVLKKSKIMNETSSEERRVTQRIFQNADNDQLFGRFNWTSEELNTQLITNGTYANERMQAWKHRLDEMIVRCSYKGRTYSCSELFQPIETSGGYCYMFNSAGNETTHTAGAYGGLTFNIHVQPEEYYVGYLSFSPGVLVTFHDPNELPMPAEKAMTISTGSTSPIQLRNKEMIKQPPYADGGLADCFDTEELPNPLEYHNIYSRSACLIECETKQVINSCGCRELLQPPMRDSEICNMREHIECVHVVKPFVAANITRLCDCPSACRTTSYTISMSTAGVHNTKKLMELYGIDEEMARIVKEELAYIDIFYSDMSYDKVEEEITYNGYDVIANLGGTLGFCLGASLLTIYEFIEFGILAIVRRITRSKLSLQHSNKLSPEESKP